MLYHSCPLYAIKSKKMLFSFLGIHEKKWSKKQFVQQSINPYIDSSDKPRLVEVPSPELKEIQKKIRIYLSRCQYPDYVFSGVKYKSHIDNARFHMGKKYLFKIDISAFFPSISREKVYLFFKNMLMNSPDVAEILTNLCTYDLSKDIKTNEKIAEFIKYKKIKQLNHLCTGSSPSPLLSYLVNKSMFDEMQSLCILNRITMTVYVDDMCFSSEHPIPSWFREQMIKIVTKNGYNTSRKKVKYYMLSGAKKITGVIIKSDGKIDIPNKLRLKIKSQFERVNGGADLNKLQGCVIAARQINKSSYPSIVEYIRKQKTSCLD